MAYARKGEDGSDVYLYKAGEGEFICHECALKQATWVGTTHGEVGYHLLEHVARGHEVPDQVFERLGAEAQGEQWETPIERAIKEMMGEAGECVCRTASCGHKARQHDVDGVCEVCKAACWR